MLRARARRLTSIVSYVFLFGFTLLGISWSQPAHAICLKPYALKAAPQPSAAPERKQGKAKSKSSPQKVQPQALGCGNDPIPGMPGPIQVPSGVDTDGRYTVSWGRASGSGWSYFC
jgi:hypothetical protein